MSLILLPALLLAAQTVPDKPQGVAPSAPTSCRLVPPPPAADERRIASLLASTDGITAERAFHVRSIREEYEILGALHLCFTMQALVEQGRHPYDVLTTIDPSTGVARDLWFDISSFFGHEF
jgi:hypothetical protein